MRPLLIIFTLLLCGMVHAGEVQRQTQANNSKENCFTDADYAIAIQMRPAQSIDDIKNILKIQLGIEALNLERYGLHIIREGNLVYICTGSIKKKLEARQENDLN